MEAVILIGLPASGKSQFYRDRFVHSHRLISLDLVKNRRHEALLIEEHLSAKQPFVVDNTNPRIEDRLRYIQPAKEQNFKVIGYFFEPNLSEALERNEQRIGKARVPKPAILSTLKRLQRPSLEEGFDELYVVRSAPGKSFTVEPWLETR